jgi:hypothetical protein
MGLWKYTCKKRAVYVTAFQEIVPSGGEYHDYKTPVLHHITIGLDSYWFRK